MILQQKIYFIAGTGTDIGKTFLLEKIGAQLKEKNMSFEAIKPVISGFKEDDAHSDSAKILQLLGKDRSKKNFDQISPWRFKEPLSPNMAARQENQTINFTDVVAFCLNKIDQARQLKNFLLIESAGGIMTPITDDKTFLDLAETLNIPVLLLTSNYLGAISHTLSAVEALKSRNITPEIIVVNNYPKDPALDIDQIAFTISNISKIKTLPIHVFLD